MITQQEGALENDIASVLGALRHNKFPAIKRGGVNRYYPTSGMSFVFAERLSFLFQVTACLSTHLSIGYF